MFDWLFFLTSFCSHPVNLHKSYQHQPAMWPQHRVTRHKHSWWLIFLFV